MNRNILTIACILVSISVMTKKANAQNQLPVPIISDDTVRYVDLNTLIYFHGGDSYDPDDGSSPGAGITKWWWNIYYEDNYYPDYISGELSTSTLPYTFTTPGYYRIALWVKGDDGEDDWTPEPYVSAAHCYIYVD